jgi:hypothetical protein
LTKTSAANDRPRPGYIYSRLVFLHSGLIRFYPFDARRRRRPARYSRDYGVRPAHVGCLIDVRLVGIISAEQSEDGKKETNDRLLVGVGGHSYDHEDIADDQLALELGIMRFST